MIKSNIYLLGYSRIEGSVASPGIQKPKRVFSQEEWDQKHIYVWFKHSWFFRDNLFKDYQCEYQNCRASNDLE